MLPLHSKFLADNKGKWISIQKQTHSLYQKIYENSNSVGKQRRNENMCYNVKNQRVQ